MEKERANALEMGKEEKAQAQKEDAEKSRRTLDPTLGQNWRLLLFCPL